MTHFHNIPKEIVESCPNFSKLLDDITRNKVGKDGFSKHISIELDETKARLNKEKENYFEKCCIYNELKEIALENRIQATSTSEKLSANSKAKELLGHLISLAETSSFLLLSPGISLFGMNLLEFQGYQRDSQLAPQALFSQIIIILANPSTSKCSFSRGRASIITEN